VATIVLDTPNPPESSAVFPSQAGRLYGRLFIEQPPGLPADYGNPEVTLEIKDMDGLDIRPAKIIYHRAGGGSW